MSADVIGAYKLVKVMMTGQTSQVWEVVEMSSHRHFAMKLLLPENTSKPELRRFLLHEADVGMKLTHPNVIRIVHVERNPKNPYFVMEFFPAGNLKGRILRKEWDFIKEKGQDILKQAATGLAFMNARGYVHRDVKPDNILVNSAGEVRLIDFAIAERIRTGIFARLFHRKAKAQGTRSYMSPEQIRGQLLDGRSDIYSFGAMAYEVVTGRPPFRGLNNQDLLNKQLYEKPQGPQHHNHDVTDEFGSLVLRMLAKRKEDRPRDFHEVLIAMRGMRVFKSQTKEKAPAP